MNKLFTSLAVGCLALGTASQVFAQAPPLSGGQIKSDISGLRFSINSPASIAGFRRVSLADWGGQGDPPLINATVVRGVDSLAASPLTNAAAIAGKVCLLYRGGGITFSQKVQYAAAAGAIGVIIVNNVSGAAAGMANTGTTTYTIPVVGVTDVDGNAMNNAIRNAPGSVTISIGSWGLGAAHDLAVAGGLQSAPHAYNVPLSQLAAGVNKQQYKNFVGGAVINYGTATETNVTLTDSVRWHPSGGGAVSTVAVNSFTIPTVNPADSVTFGFGNAASSYSLPAPTSTGFYSYNYRITYANTDGFPTDNALSINQYVTDSIFCKGTYNYTTNRPNATLSIRPGSTTATQFSLGSLFYVTAGRYAARKIQFAVTKNTVPTLDGEEAFGLVFKWTDGSAAMPLDSFVQGAELKLAALVYKAFSTADTVGAFQTLALRDPSVATRTVILDSNSWYWVAAQTTANCFVSVDETVGFFTRPYIQSQLFGYQEMPVLLNTADYASLSTSADPLAPFPFGNNAFNIDSTLYDRFNETPAVALHISKNPIPAGGVGVSNVAQASVKTLNLFPIPASGVLNVDIALNSTTKDVRYRILDATGKIVYKLDHANVLNERFTIPTESLATGNYYFVVVADGEATAQSITIAR